MRDERLLSSYRTEKYIEFHQNFYFLFCIEVLDEWKNMKLMNLNPI
jgi:hypothetical protein